MTKRLLSPLFTVACLLASTLIASPLSAATLPRPMLLTTPSTNDSPIRVQSLSAEVEISGTLAQTTVEMQLNNPTGRVLEGELQLPLLANQQVTGFALDIDGALRPAVPVEKAKGRQVFEEIERRRVDPGLLEQTVGNNFRLRVYPIPPQGNRRVRIVFSGPLERQGQELHYQFPMAYSGMTTDFSLTVEVQNSPVAPKVSSSLGAMRFEPDGFGVQARLKRKNVVPGTVLGLQLPASTQTQVYRQINDDGAWFVAEVPIAGKAERRVLPKVLGLLWDSSGSGAARNTADELAVLDRYFKAMGNGEVRLTRLRDKAEPTVSYPIVNGDWSALKQALRDTVYDGASALNDWQPQADVGGYLLVSDGINNYGNKPFPTLAAKQRLDALNSAVGAYGAKLNALTNSHGGKLVDLLQEGSVNAAADALLNDAPRLVDIDATGAADVASETPFARNGLLRLAGKLTASSGNLKLTVQTGQQRRQINVPLPAKAPEHPYAGRLWAGYRIAALQADDMFNRAAIRRLGQQFGVVTPETSLIVLDRLDDYVRYDIAPPALYADAYEKLRALRGSQIRVQQKSHLDNVVREFEEKVSWWEKDWPKGARPTPKPAPKPTASDQRRERSNEVNAESARQSSVAGAMAPRAAPAPAPAPAAAPAPVMMKAAESSDSVAGSDSSIAITLKQWAPDSPYANRLRATAPDQLYRIYLDEKPSYANSSAFYLDVADLLLEKGQRELALRVLSNLAEMNLESPHLLRILGYRLLQAGEPRLAIPVFEQVLRMAEEEPQSFRDLGLAYAANGEDQKAIDQLNRVVEGTWDSRFAEIELISLAEMNAIIANAKQSLDTSRIDPRLKKNLPLDLRVALTWDADNTDMDLWVTDPNGEKCFYGHRFTYQGGRISRDSTGGYGPEEFSLKTAKPGKYKIEANYFGSRQQIITGAITLQVKLSTAFGKANQQDQMITLRLKDKTDTVFVGEFEVKGK
ncbi:VIT domain-containing protein [Andreprevotia chitinilytica]|uniref:VIT domain-containing protein n=1 Tax=Andreprevotia chitinilytica TaxID=396808 RepID=UPI000554C015|nr:VIT domain-containing protein [Andreprevotia chitinilytica]